MPRETELQSKTRAAMAVGEVDSAFDLYEAALAKGASCAVRIEYASLLWQCYEYQRAISLFNELVEDPHTETLTLQIIAKAYFLAGRFSEAAKVMQVSVTRDDNPDSELLVQLASCLERDNQIGASIEAAERAHKLAPSNHGAVRQLAHNEKRDNNYEAAVKRIKSQLIDFPDGPNWKLRYELAASLDRLGEYDRAWMEMENAKAQLFQQSKKDLDFSCQIRRRQGEFVKLVNDDDLRRWYQTSVEDSPPKRIALLAGFPRSGTTLLEQILTSHSEVVGTDETGILTTQFVSPIVWQAKDAFDALLEIRGLDNKQLLSGRESYCRFTEAVIGERIDDRLLIEKDPLMTCDLPFPLRLFPGASIIMPLRDPRDVIVSYFFTMVPLNWNSSPSTNIVESARFYHDVMRHWLLLRNRLPWPSIETRYEDLVAAQVTETKKLTEFLGLTFDKSMLDVKKRSSANAVSTPTYDDITKPLYPRAVGRWQNYRKHLEPALAILDPYAREFGYE